MMEKFRSKREPDKTVDAFQWEGDVEALKRWLADAGIHVMGMAKGEDVPGTATEVVVSYVACVRLEMPHHEWLVRSIDGIETYCPRGFNAMYEKAEEE